jgi:DNA polymerase-3 subunit alpha
LGEHSKVFPSDAALARFKELMPAAQAQVVYGEG